MIQISIAMDKKGKQQKGIEMYEERDVIQDNNLVSSTNLVSSYMREHFCYNVYRNACRVNVFW